MNAPRNTMKLWIGGILALSIAFGIASWAYLIRPSVPPQGEPAAAPWFLDITEQMKVDFVHDAGPTGDYPMPQSMGSGAAFFDFDNDGRLDIYLLNNGGPNGARNCLLHQRPDGTFEDVSAGSGLDVAGCSMGVAVGDVNNDGRTDVLLTQYRGIRLFLNEGKGKFREVTREAGLDSVLWGASAAFLDFDRDGWLDLVVANYASYSPSANIYIDGSGRRDYFQPSPTSGQVAQLFRNRGRKADGAADSVRFDDATSSSGLGSRPSTGLGVVCADFNGDRWPDIFIANDGLANHLWINQKDGTFKEEAVPRGIAYDGLGNKLANMGIALGDVRGEGFADVFVTHLSSELSTLWRQTPRGLFQDATAAAGLARPRWRGTGFGAAFADFDHDGALDLAVVNGDVRRRGQSLDPAALKDLDPFWRSYAQRNQLFTNTGNGVFRDISEQQPAFCGTPNVARGLAWGDFDNDGAVDLLVTAAGGRARLYRNIAEKKGHWLLVRALDPSLRRDAYGAEVVVHAGGRRFLGLVNPGSSYMCSNDPRVHFGLGPTATIDAIHVVWPDGIEEVFPGRSADAMVVLRKGEGKTAGK